MGVFYGLYHYHNLEKIVIGQFALNRLPYLQITFSAFLTELGSHDPADGIPTEWRSHELAVGNGRLYPYGVKVVRARQIATLSSQDTSLQLFFPLFSKEIQWFSS